MSYQRQLPRFLITSVLALTVLVQWGGEQYVNAISDTSCKGDIGLIRVRGSGDKRGTDTTLNRIGNEGNTGSQLTLDAVSLAFRSQAKEAGLSVNEYDLEYPALSTEYILKDLVNSLQGLLSSTYLQSIVTGTNKLISVLEAKRTCTHPLVIIGYSQGAVVVADALSRISDDLASRIGAVAIFGDARFDPSDPIARGNYESGRKGIASLLLGIRQLGERFETRAVSYCYYDDLVCQGLNSDIPLFYGYGLRKEAQLVLDRQINSHARGYACDAMGSDSICRKYVDLGRPSVAKSVGLALFSQLGLPRSEVQSVNDISITWIKKPNWTWNPDTQRFVEEATVRIQTESGLFSTVWPDNYDKRVFISARGPDGYQIPVFSSINLVSGDRFDGTYYYNVEGAPLPESPLPAGKYTVTEICYGFYDCRTARKGEDVSFMVPVYGY